MKLSSRLSPLRYGANVLYGASVLIWFVCLSGCRAPLPFQPIGRNEPRVERASVLINRRPVLHTHTDRRLPIQRVASTTPASLVHPWEWREDFDKEWLQRELEDVPSAASSASLWTRLWSDQKNFYSAESLTLLGSGFAVGGAMANTSIDEGIQRHFQSSVRGATSDEWFESLHASKELGNGMYTLPVFATAWVAGEVLPDNAMATLGGRWGERSLRGFAVGAPPLVALQQLTGGSRPTENLESSEWHPFHDNNGVSGHSFMGSLPFITAAKMTDNPAYKTLFYAGSAIAPLSRVNDNAHYPSQVVLGWWMAYLAASAIDATDNPNARWKFSPLITREGSGIQAEIQF
ncbi:phosphatase PAP2 family protein [Pirellulaceae bacterium SH467]